MIPKKIMDVIQIANFHTGKVWICGLYGHYFVVLRLDIRVEIILACDFIH